MNGTLDRANKHWPHLAPLLTAPKNDSDYKRLNTVLDELLDAGAADEAHPLAGLASLIGDLLEAFDEEHRPMPAVAGPDLLRALMAAHGLRQSDLPEVGAQPVVSAILAGKREINARQARALAARFNVDAGAFLEPAPAGSAKGPILRPLRRSGFAAMSFPAIRADRKAGKRAAGKGAAKKAPPNRSPRGR